MKWTNKKPTIDGFYFVKCVGQLSGNKFTTVVKVYNDCSSVFFDGENYTLNDDAFLEWSDVPIDPPNPSDDGRASARPVQQLVGQTSLPEQDNV